MAFWSSKTLTKHATNFSCLQSGVGCREQILGDEARAKVPAEFVVQNNQNANPPTLFLPLQLIVKQLINSDKPADKQYLQHLYPRLQAWYSWFNTSQVQVLLFALLCACICAFDDSRRI